MEKKSGCCEDVGFLLKQIDDAVKKSLDAQMADCGITMTQSRVLFFLAFREGRKAYQKEIENYLGVTHPTVVGLIKRLEEKGYITTTPDLSDRRARIISLTKKAEKFMEQIVKNKKQMEKKMLRGISREEKEELLRMLHIIKENVKED